MLEFSHSPRETYLDIWSEKIVHQACTRGHNAHFLMPKIPYFKAQVYCAHLSHTGICSAWMKKPAKSSWGTKTSVLHSSIYWSQFLLAHYQSLQLFTASKLYLHDFHGHFKVWNARWLPVLPAAQLLHWLQCNQPTKRWMLQQCQWARKSGHTCKVLTPQLGCWRLKIRASNLTEPVGLGYGLPFPVYCASGKIVAPKDQCLCWRYFFVAHFSRSKTLSRVHEHLHLPPAFL